MTPLREYINKLKERKARIAEGREKIGDGNGRALRTHQFNFLLETIKDLETIEAQQNEIIQINK